MRSPRELNNAVAADSLMVHKLQISKPTDSTLRQKTPLPLNVSYICPEPVLAK